MCGIVGLFLKDKSLEPRLGSMLEEMLITMTDRGPDSAGIAVYRGANDGMAKITIQSKSPDTEFAGLQEDLEATTGLAVKVTVKDTHAVIDVAEDSLDAAREALAECRPEIRVMSYGDAVEIYKETGLPEDVSRRFDLASMSGTHGVGHTRMATESAITTLVCASLFNRSRPVSGAQWFSVQPQ